MAEPGGRGFDPRVWGLLCVESACSPTVQRHAREVRRELWQEVEVVVCLPVWPFDKLVDINRVLVK